MNIPISWIKEYFEIDNVQKLCDDLTLSGTKVEAIHKHGQELKNIVIGKIEKLNPHPNADKLIVTETNCGDKTYTIVTGATNLKVGDIVPVALPGSIIWGGIELGKKDFRGVESFGMLCSIDELGATTTDFPEATENGIYVFKNGNEIELGSDAAKVLELVQDVIELELTSNRPDCYSVTGILREIKALGYKPKKEIFVDYNDFDKKLDKSETADKYLKIKIENKEQCFHYVARVVKNVKIEPSPQWLRRRLTLSGIRPKNNIVDITNYVMLEHGQPLHAFDMEKVSKNIEGKHEIIIRNAKDEEKITTLDDSQFTLKQSNLVIADNQKVLAIAGVMGGLDSAITEDTTTVIFESANFFGSGIRTTSKEVGIRTDSSGRFEKGLDPSMSWWFMERCMELIQEIGCGDIVSGQVREDVKGLESHAIVVNWNNINKLLGTDLSKEKMKEILEKLDFKVDDDTINIPFFRKDVKCEADIAEEIIRMYGFDKIIPVVDNVVAVGRKTKRQVIEDLLSRTAISLGLNQIITYSFENPQVLDMLNIEENHYLRDVVTISNPLGDSSIMRSTTLGSMLGILRTNYAKRNLDVSLFDIGKIYKKASDKPLEELCLTIGMYNKSNQSYDFYYTKGIVEQFFKALGIQEIYEPVEQAEKTPYLHPGRAALIIVEGKPVGYIGQIHPIVAENYEIKLDIYVAFINLELVLPYVKLEKSYKEASKYPAVSRDIAIKISTSKTANQVKNLIEKESGELLESIELFDVYQGEQIESGYKSMAYSLSFRHKDKTLEDKDVNPVMDNIVKKLEQELSATLR